LGKAFADNEINGMPIDFNYSHPMLQVFSIFERRNLITKMFHVRVYLATMTTSVRVATAAADRVQCEEEMPFSHALIEMFQLFVSFDFRFHSAFMHTHTLFCFPFFREMKRNE
jgi:hypothetical protein